MYKKILIPTDGSESSLDAESHGLKLAKKMGASVTVLHVVEPIYAPQVPAGSPPIMFDDQIETLEAAGEKIVEHVKEKGEKEGVTITTVVVRGHPAHEIIEYAKEHDLVVMGTLGGSALAHLFMGSVTEKVARHAPCPVLVVRHKRK